MKAGDIGQWSCGDSSQRWPPTRDPSREPAGTCWSSPAGWRARRKRRSQESSRSHPHKVQIPISRSRAKPGTFRLEWRKPALTVAGCGVGLPWGWERFGHFWGETHGKEMRGRWTHGTHGRRQHQAPAAGPGGAWFIPHAPRGDPRLEWGSPHPQVPPGEAERRLRGVPGGCGR